jgi:hypothetical protein
MGKGAIMAVLTKSHSHACRKVKVVTQEDLSVFVVAAIASHPLQFEYSFLKSFG